MTWNTLPPHLALHDMDGVLVPPGLCGPVAQATIEAHRVFLLAAAYMLSAWYAQGARSTRLRDGRVEPGNLPPEEGTWPVNDIRAAEAVVATVMLGERYAGWGRAVMKASLRQTEEAA